MSLDFITRTATLYTRLPFTCASTSTASCTWNARCDAQQPSPWAESCPGMLTLTPGQGGAAGQRCLASEGQLPRNNKGSGPGTFGQGNNPVSKGRVPRWLTLSLRQQSSGSRGEGRGNLSVQRNAPRAEGLGSRTLADSQPRIAHAACARLRRAGESRAAHAARRREAAQVRAALLRQATPVLRQAAPVLHRAAPACARDARRSGAHAVDVDISHFPRANAMAT